MAVRMSKAWQSREAVAELPGHMGVFELADADGRVLRIGYAGGRSRFGLRGEIEAALTATPDAAAFRIEVTTAYLTRYQELLMVHVADHGALPVANSDEPMRLGRLSPA